MTCDNCGSPLAPNVKFRSDCGQPAGNAIRPVHVQAIPATGPFKPKRRILPKVILVVLGVFAFLAVLGWLQPDTKKNTNAAPDRGAGSETGASTAEVHGKAELTWVTPSK